MDQINNTTTTRKDLHLYFLWLLICTDVLLIIIHMITRYGPTFGPIDIIYRLQVDVEFGYPEFFQYVKTYWVILFFGALGYKLRQSVYFVWALFFGYYLVDDAIQIHETVGYRIGENLPMFGAWSKDIGEIMVYAFIGIILLISIAIAYRFSDNNGRMATRNIGFLLGMLVFFGFFTDFVHAALKFIRGNSLLAVIEDGGEMLMMSVICWYALNLFQHRNNMEALDYVARFNPIHLYKNKKLSE